MSQKSPKRPSPLSLRLSAKERAELERRARGRPLSEYIKDVLFANTRAPIRIRGQILEDRQLYAKGLGLLGQSEVFTSLKQICAALESGSLPYSAEIRDEMLEAHRTIREIRGLLISSMGLNPTNYEGANDAP